MSNPNSAVQKRTITDVETLCPVDLTDAVGDREDMRLFELLRAVGTLPTEASFDRNYTPTTRLGQITKLLMFKAADFPNRTRGMCHEAEPYFMESLMKLTNGLASDTKASIYIDEDHRPIAFRKNAGASTTLITRPHPTFADLPAGVIVTTQRPDAVVETSNPFLSIVPANEDVAVKSFDRPTTFMLDPDEVASWGYNLERALVDRNLAHLAPYSVSASSTPFEEVVQYVDDLAAQAMPSPASFAAAQC